MKKILRGLGLIACWFLVVCIAEALHGVATGLGLLPYPGKGGMGAVDWFIVVVSALLVLFFYFRYRWRKRKQHYLAVVRFENLLDRLEEMVDEHREGKHDWSKAIKFDLEWLEQNLSEYKGHAITKERLDNMREAL
jgi:hypothetical protein